MFKSIQTKIMAIIIMLAILSFAIFEILALGKLQKKEIEKELIVQIKQTGIGIMVIYTIISSIILFFASRLITKPIYKLIENAKEVATGQENQIKNIKEGKSKTEIDELADTFQMMTEGLRENLNEVSRQKKQIETILLHMTDGVIAFDLHGEIIHINPAAKQFLKITPTKKNFSDIFKKLPIEVSIEKIIYLENWTTTEQKISLDDRYMNLFFAPFKDENERAAGIIVVIQDITEHVKLDNMRKEFIADVSHELKTPLTSIMGYADTLATAEYDKELQEKFLGVISSEAIRMTKLVNDLLTLSKHDNTETKWEKSEFNLGELVKHCQENLQIESSKKNQSVECFVTANVPPVYADKDGIERVVLNILSNSIKYTEENGTIKIYVGFVYNDAYIKIIDNGIGIPENDLNRIFDRFYRVDKARTRTMGGTGLGLSIAKEILDKNGGRIDIKSVLGKGTEVVITIPTVQK